MPATLLLQGLDIAPSVSTGLLRTSHVRGHKSRYIFQLAAHVCFHNQIDTKAPEHLLGVKREEKALM